MPLPRPTSGYFWESISPNRVLRNVLAPLFQPCRARAGQPCWQQYPGLPTPPALLPGLGSGLRSTVLHLPLCCCFSPLLQSYFVAVVAKASASERLALLAWSPPGCRRVLLTVTSSGRAFSWGMEPPAAAAEAVPGAAPAGGGEGGGGHVPCVNRWYGRPAFELPLQRAGAFAEEPSLGFYGEDAANGAASSRKRHRLLCGRFLEPPGHAAAAWDVAGAPPFSDRQACSPGGLGRLQSTCHMPLHGFFSCLCQPNSSSPSIVGICWRARVCTRAAQRRAGRRCCWPALLLSCRRVAPPTGR